MQLDYPLPDKLAVGGGTAVFVCGWCFCPGAAIARSPLFLTERSQPVMAERMPRADVFKALHPRLDPSSARSSDIRSRFSGGSRAAQLSQRLLGARAAGAGTGGHQARAAAARHPRRTASQVEAALGRIAGRGAFRGRAVEHFGAGAGGGAPCGDLHGDLQPAARAAEAPARLDPRADPSKLGLRDQRRLLEPRMLRGPRAGGGGRPPLRGLPVSRAAALLPQLRARPQPRSAERRLRGDGRPGRLLAPRQAGDPARRDRQRPAGLQRRPHHRPPGRADLRHLLEHPAPQPRRPARRS